MLVDSHCHLNYEGLVEDQPAVLARARAAGVKAFLNISTRLSEWDAVVATAEREPDVWASVGIHPHEAEQHADLGEAALLEATNHSRVIGIGETGLDYYYDKSDRAVQRALFRIHAAVSRLSGLPLIVHTRDAESDTASILAEEMQKGPFPALIHCFTASAEFGRRVLELGLTISLSGIVTFKNARELQEFAPQIPADRLLVETDSPFLAPVPYRGKTCEPAYVRSTAEFVAGLRGETVETLAGKHHPQLLRPVQQGHAVKLVVLGSGTSTGVPRIGNDWGECDPNEPKNRRTRVSILVESEEGTRLLVDTSTDLRHQLLANNIDKVDAVFWTHDHADHCHGIDDLRPMRFNRQAPLPGFASEMTARSLRQRFSYVFAGRYGYPTIVQLETLELVKIHAGFAIDSVEMPHGPTFSTAYRFEADGKSIVYATDFSEVTSEMIALFTGADILVTDCLRREPHPTHASLATALDLHTRCKPRTTVLTHLDMSMDYATLSTEVPAGVVVGYDGMELVA